MISYERSTCRENCGVLYGAMSVITIRADICHLAD